VHVASLWQFVIPYFIVGALCGWLVVLDFGLLVKYSNLMALQL